MLKSYFLTNHLRKNQEFVNSKAIIVECVPKTWPPFILFWCVQHQGSQTLYRCSSERVRQWLDHDTNGHQSLHFSVHFVNSYFPVRIILDQVIFLQLIFCGNVIEICFIGLLIFKIILSDFSLECGMTVDGNTMNQSDYAWISLRYFFVSADCQLKCSEEQGFLSTDLTWMLLHSQLYLGSDETWFVMFSFCLLSGILLGLRLSYKNVELLSSVNQIFKSGS